MKLNLEWQEQREPLWCWAACMSIVLARVSPLLQCRIVSALRTPHDCCPQPVTSPCCDALEPQKVGMAWDAVQIADIQVEGPLTFTDIKNEVDDCRPVMIGVGPPSASFRTGSGHAVLAYGYTATKVLIHDPAFDDEVLYDPDFSTVRMSYVWRWTWRGLPKVDQSC